MGLTGQALDTMGKASMGKALLLNVAAVGAVAFAWPHVGALKARGGLTGMSLCAPVVRAAPCVELLYISPRLRRPCVDAKIRKPNNFKDLLRNLLSGLDFA